MLEESLDSHGHNEGHRDRLRLKASQVESSSGSISGVAAGWVSKKSANGKILMAPVGKSKSISPARS